jgi:hypothetical protein
MAVIWQGKLARGSITRQPAKEWQEIAGCKNRLQDAVAARPESKRPAGGRAQGQLWAGACE